MRPHSLRPRGARAPAVPSHTVFARTVVAHTVVAHAVLAFTVLATSVWPAAARANPFDVYGFSPRAIGMGGAFTSLADDFTATYYNPAGLTQRQKVHFGIGFQSSIPALSIERVKSDLARPSASPSTHNGITVGALFPLGAKIDNRIAFGIGLYVPTSSLFRLDSIDQGTPQWYQYQALPDKLVIAPALGFRILDKLSVGAGLLVLADLTGTGTFSVDLVNRRLSQRDLSVDLGPTVSGTAGVMVGPFAGLRFGFSFRGNLALNFHLPPKINLEGVGSISLDIKGVASWTPNQYTFATSYEFPSKRLRVAFDLTIAQWSDAPDPATKLDVSATGDVIGKLGLSGALNIKSPDLPLGASNTVTPRFGVEWNITDDWALRGGYFYRPTPLPKQDGFTNYLDNDAHGFSAGVAWTAPDYLEIHNHPVTLEFSLQTLYLPNRSVTKRAASDPVGNLQSSGAYFTLAVSLRHDF